MHFIVHSSAHKMYVDATRIGKHATQAAGTRINASHNDKGSTYTTTGRRTDRSIDTCKHGASKRGGCADVFHAAFEPFGTWTNLACCIPRCVRDRLLLTYLVRTSYYTHITIHVRVCGQLGRSRLRRGIDGWPPDRKGRRGRIDRSASESAMMQGRRFETISTTKYE